MSVITYYENIVWTILRYFGFGFRDFATSSIGHWKMTVFGFRALQLVLTYDHYVKWVNLARENTSRHRPVVPCRRRWHHVTVTDRNVLFSLFAPAGVSSFTLMGVNFTILVVASLIVVSILGVCVIVLTVYCICYRTTSDALPISRHGNSMHDTSNNFQSEYERKTIITTIAIAVFGFFYFFLIRFVIDKTERDWSVQTTREQERLYYAITLRVILRRLVYILCNHIAEGIVS